jgi:hypothetical protein
MAKLYGTIRNPNKDLCRYAARPAETGWEVMDTNRGTIATLNDTALSQMDVIDAQTLARMLNEFELEKSSTLCH